MGLLILRRTAIAGALSAVGTVVFILLDLARAPEVESALLAVRHWNTPVYALLTGAVAIGSLLGIRTRSPTDWAVGLACAFIVVSLARMNLLVFLSTTLDSPELYVYVLLLGTSGLLPLPPLLYAGTAVLGVAATSLSMALTASPGDPIVMEITMLATAGVIAIVIQMSNFRRWRVFYASVHEAERAAQRRDEFLRILAHDLRSPIGAIPDFVRMLRDRIAPAEREKIEYELDILESTAGSTWSMLENLLLWGRRDESAAALSDTEFDLVMLIRRLLERHQAHLHVKGIALESDLEDACFVRADREHVRAILHNIVGNAIKFTPAGGRVSVVQRFDAADETAVVTVADTGIGMDPEDRSVHRRGTAGERGTGVGLSLVMSLAEKVGARVEIESAPGAGTTVDIVIPGALARPASPEDHS